MCNSLRGVTCIARVLTDENVWYVWHMCCVNHMDAASVVADRGGSSRDQCMTAV